MKRIFLMCFWGALCLFLAACNTLQSEDRSSADPSRLFSVVNQSFSQIIDANAASKYQEAVQEARKYGDEVVVMVNDVPIYRSNFMLAKAGYDFAISNALWHLTGLERDEYLQNHKQSNDDILQQLIQKEILLQECIRLGVAVDEEKIAEEVRKYHDILENEDPEWYFENILKLTGLTKDEQINQEQIPAAIKSAKLNLYYQHEFPDVTTEEDLQIAIKQKLEELKDEYDVIYLEPINE